MASFSAKVLLGDQVVIPKVRVNLESNGWGTFVLPRGCIVTLRDDYALLRDDRWLLYVGTRRISSNGVVKFRPQGGWREIGPTTQP
jgi:hypothetical protein